MAIHIMALQGMNAAPQSLSHLTKHPSLAMASNHTFRMDAKPKFQGLACKPWLGCRLSFVRRNCCTTSLQFTTRVCINCEVGNTLAVSETEKPASLPESEIPVATNATASKANSPSTTSSRREARRASDWARAASMLEHGGIHKGTVEAANKGGVLLRFGSLLAFVPYSQLHTEGRARARVSSGTTVEGSEDDTVAKTDTVSEEGMVAIGKKLVGQTLTAQVVDVDENARRLVLSEKRATTQLALRQLQLGQVLPAIVAQVAEFGAFVDVQVAMPGGSACQVATVRGLLHVSEVSWDRVSHAGDKLQPGDELPAVKVIGMDKKAGRLSLSLKQLQTDPLLETLDSLMPAGTTTDSQAATDDASSASPSSASSSSLLTPPASSPDSDTFPSVSGVNAESLGVPLPGLEAICSELRKEEGVSEVALGRQAVEQRVVSQDLELWLSNAPVECEKYTLLARAGRQVQEVYVSTTLDREGMKRAVQRVTGRVQ